MRPTFKGNSYSLTPIAETGERFSDFAPYVSAIDNRGVVAFQAALTDGGSGVYTSEGGRVTTVADSATGPFAGVSSHPAINSGGSCCFYATLGPEGQGVFVVHDGETTAASGSAGPLGTTMNEAGAIAFRAPTDAGHNGVFLYDGDAVTTIADTTGRFTGFHGLPVVAGDGTVIFRADVEGGEEGIYFGDGETATVVVATGGTFGSLGPVPSANDAGTVAFCATLRAGGAGVFTAMRGEIITVIDTSGAFESFRGALLDGSGRCVFYGTPRGGGLGLFAGPDPETDCLLAVGSPLLGSTVAGFALNPVSINDAGQLAVRVALLDGRQLMIRADPG